MELLEPKFCVMPLCEWEAVEPVEKPDGTFINLCAQCKDAYLLGFNTAANAAANKPKSPKYNTMCDVGYTVLHDHENPEDITREEHLQALEVRLASLRAYAEDGTEPFGICDTYEIEAGAKDDWKKVVFASACDEEGNCPNCKIDYGQCGCPGPTMDDHEYKEVNGVMYARKKE